MPDAGTPVSVPVEVLKVTPEGRAPDSLIVGTGNPLAVTGSDPLAPTVKVVLFVLNIAAT